jgi:hypothetical protein
MFSHPTPNWPKTTRYHIHPPTPVFRSLWYHIIHASSQIQEISGFNQKVGSFVDKLQLLELKDQIKIKKKFYLTRKLCFAKIVYKLFFSFVKYMNEHRLYLKIINISIHHFLRECSQQFVGIFRDKEDHLHAEE